MTRLAIMFTDPGMARVGEVPEGVKTVSGFASYADQGRAKVFLTNRGCVRIDADAIDGRLLAAQMVGPAVEHHAHLLALAIGQSLTADALLAMPFYHPTYEEGLERRSAPISGIAPASCPAPECIDCAPLPGQAVRPSSASALTMLGRALSRS